MNEVIRDPTSKQEPLWRVIFNDRITTPCFTSKGAGEAYLDMLTGGRRKPEYGARS